MASVAPRVALASFAVRASVALASAGLARFAVRAIDHGELRTGEVRASLTPLGLTDFMSMTRLGTSWTP